MSVTPTPFFMAWILFVGPFAPDQPNNTSDMIAMARKVAVQVTGQYSSGRSSSMQWGGGVLIGDGRLVLTCLHTIQGYPEVVVQTYDGRSHATQVLAEFPEKDLAILKLLSDEVYRGIALNRTSTETGESGFVVGFPGFGDRSIRFARFTPVTSRVLYSNIDHQTPLVGLQCTVTTGFSGGPVFTTAGELAGIVLARSGSQKAFALGVDEILSALRVDQLPSKRIVKTSSHRADLAETLSPEQGI